MLLKSESLLFHGHLSDRTVDKMREIRKKYYILSRELEKIGQAREVSLAFTELEKSLMYAIKALAILDPEAIREEICIGDEDENK